MKAGDLRTRLDSSSGEVSRLALDCGVCQDCGKICLPEFIDERPEGFVQKVCKKECECGGKIKW